MTRKMTIRERVLATVHGENVAPPFTIYRGLLPRGQAERELRELGLGLQWQVPVYKEEHPHVEIERRTREVAGERITHTLYHTPLGDAELITRVRDDAGYGSAWTVQPLIRSVRDCEIMCFVANDAVYTPNYDGLRDAERLLGQDGIVLGSVGLSPFQVLVNPDWLGMDGVSYWLADHPAELDALYAALARGQEKVYEIAAGAPVELIHSDENVTAVFVGPRLYRRYHLPFYQRLAPQLHAAGKLYVCHFDGSLRPLKQEIAESPIDVMEAFTPPPMGDLPVREAKAAWPNKTIWSNFPGALFLADDQTLRRFTSDLLDEAAGGRFVLGITENMDEDTMFRSLRILAEELNKRY